MDYNCTSKNEVCWPVVVGAECVELLAWADIPDLHTGRGPRSQTERRQQQDGGDEARVETGADLLAGETPDHQAVAGPRHQAVSVRVQAGDDPGVRDVLQSVQQLHVLPLDRVPALPQLPGPVPQQHDLLPGPGDDQVLLQPECHYRLVPVVSRSVDGAECLSVPHNHRPVSGGRHDQAVSDVDSEQDLVLSGAEVVLVQPAVEEGDELAAVNAVDLGQTVGQAGYEDPVITGQTDHLCLPAGQNCDLRPPGLPPPPPRQVAPLQPGPQQGPAQSSELNSGTNQHHPNPQPWVVKFT